MQQSQSVSRASYVMFEQNFLFNVFFFQFYAFVTMTLYRLVVVTALNKFSLCGVIEVLGIRS